jgi:hypothetical protein
VRQFLNVGLLESGHERVQGVAVGVLHGRVMSRGGHHWQACHAIAGMENLVFRPVIRAIRQQISDMALIELGQMSQDVQGGGVTRRCWPALPVGDVLEGLGIIRPARIPPIGYVTLTPSVSEPQRYARIYPLRVAEYGRDLGPGVACRP